MFVVLNVMNNLIHSKIYICIINYFFIIVYETYIHILLFRHTKPYCEGRFCLFINLLKIITYALNFTQLLNVYERIVFFYNFNVATCDYVIYHNRSVLLLAVNGPRVRYELDRRVNLERSIKKFTLKTNSNVG